MIGNQPFLKQYPVLLHLFVAVITQDLEVLTLLGYTEVIPVIPLPAITTNAARVAALTQTPVIAELTDTLWDFTNDTSIYLHSFPQLVGRSIAGECLQRQPDLCRAAPMDSGFMNVHSAYALSI